MFRVNHKTVSFVGIVASRFRDRYNSVMDTQKNFREQVERRLARRGWTRSEFAGRLGVTPGYVTQVLNGHRGAGWRTMDRWAMALGVRPELLILPVLEKTKKVS